MSQQHSRNIVVERSKSLGRHLDELANRPPGAKEAPQAGVKTPRSQDSKKIGSWSSRTSSRGCDLCSQQKQHLAACSI